MGQGESYVRSHAKAPSSGPSTRHISRLGAVIRGAFALTLALVAFLGIGAPATMAAAPTVTIDPAAGITATTAEVSGEVNPEGASTSWRFEYITDEAYDENLENSNPGFQGSATGPSGSTEAVEPVAGQLTGLVPNTRYHLRLVAESSEGSAEAVAPTFKTAGAAPTVKAWAAGPVASTAADINAQVNPHGSATVYWFEWGTSDCSANPCASLPAERDASAGEGEFLVYVLRHLSGLNPETTYHFRVVAENASGTTEGPDQTFTTAAPAPPCDNGGMPGADHLPDCRAWEMVSPPEKGGADVIPTTYKTFAAEVGDGASFVTTGGFGELEGTSTDVQYTSRRDGGLGTRGWSTHSINPPNRALGLLPLFFANISGFQTVSPDLSDGIYKSWGPLTDAPNVAGVSNLYRLRDLDTGVSQAQLLSASATQLTPNPASDPGVTLLQNSFAGASKDLSHVIFQSPWQLIGDGSHVGEPGDLYEQVEGMGVRRVGRVPVSPASQCDDLAGPTCEDAANAQAGVPVRVGLGSSQYADGMISADGSRIVFTVPSGVIYLREAGTRTYQLNASERSTPDAPAGAQAWAMSADGSRVFFTSSEALVDGDGDGGAADLYMYDVSAPAGSRLTLVSAGGASTSSVTAVVGSSADGHYVYFTSDGQFVPEEPEALHGLYLWHDNDLSYIGSFGDSNVAKANTPFTIWDTSGFAKASRVSPDGRHLLFMSSIDAGFAGRGGHPGSDSGGRMLQLYSAESGRLICISCSPLSDAAIIAFTDVQPGGSVSPLTQHLSHALSDDGRHVFFSTKAALVAEDTNGVTFDAYEYDTVTGNLHLISSGTSSSDSYFMDASPDGSDAFFVTRERLVGWDVDDSYDLYDARVAGGFAEPVSVPAPCEGESCKTSPQPAPSVAPTASQAPGEGNRKPPCPRGKKPVKRGGKVRCVKPKKKRAHAKHGRADSDRRAGR